MRSCAATPTSTPSPATRPTPRERLRVATSSIGSDFLSQVLVGAAVTAIEAAARAETKTPRTRDNSKQATVIGMLKRPEGATIQQIVEATSWQAHTVRGTFAGAFKKKLGLTIVSDKAQGSERVYRIAAEA